MTLRTVSGILAGIIEHKREEVVALRAKETQLERQAQERRTSHRPFAQAIRAAPAIIAEVKKASPSKGLLQPDFDPCAIAQAYERGGATCISVLTDGRYFEGSLADLEAARNAVKLPVIRKDFTIDQLQIFEAAAHDADAILLIAAVLSTSELSGFRELASSLSMASLVEVHDEEELRKAVDSGAEIIGVNNRNLDTFEVSLDTSLRLSQRMPANLTRVSESGIRTHADIALLQAAGFHAFLIGETLMKSADPAASLRALLEAI